MEEVLLETIADIQARKRRDNEKPDHVLFNCYSTGGTEHYGTIPVQGLESLLGKPVKD